MNNQRLEVEVVNGRLVISIGVDTLKYCHNLIERENVIGYGPGPGFFISDATGFAKDVAAKLVLEEEDGTTPVHLLLDKAVQDAADDGSIHTSEKEENI